jgi:hypothetical protein
MRGVLCISFALLLGCGRLGYDDLAGGIADDGGADIDGDIADFDASTSVGFDSGVTQFPPIAPLNVVPSGVLSSPVIEWDGNGYGVAWLEAGTPSSSLKFTRLDVNGAQIFDQPVQVTDGSVATSHPYISVGENQYGIGWRIGGSAGFQAVSGDGALIGSSYQATAIGVNNPRPLRVGSSASQHALVFTVEAIGIHTVVYSLFELSGAASVESQSIGNASTVLTCPVFNGATWTVGGSNNGEVWVSAFANTPINVLTRLDDTTDQSSNPVLGRLGNTTAMVWTDRLPSDDYNLMVRTVGVDGLPTSAPIHAATIVQPLVAPVPLFSKPSPSGAEIVISFGTVLERYVIDPAGALLGSEQVFQLPPGAVLSRSGPGLAMVWLEGDTVWFQRIE